jgi:hypothetical protein
MVKVMMKALVFMFVTIAFASSAQAGQPIGTVAIYSDGQVEKLIEVGKEWTLWEDQRKRRYKKSYLPFLPPLAYQKFPDRTQGYTHGLMFGAPKTLQPYGSNRSVKFDLLRTNTASASTSKRYWSCAYTGRGGFSLGKKKFKTQNYSCFRVIYKKEIYPERREVVDLKYSPTLNLVVDRSWSDTRGDSERVKLSRLLSPEKATAKRISRTVYKLRTSK